MGHNPHMRQLKWVVELLQILEPVFQVIVELLMLIEARVTALSCQWLMGPCAVNAIEISDGSSCKCGVSGFQLN